jgi:hypothetical protein
MIRTRQTCGIVLAFLIAFICIVFSFKAWGHDAEMAKDPDEARVFAFYDGWKRPPARFYSCCSKTDCHVVDLKRDEHGKLMFFDTSQQLWRVIPEEIIESNLADPRESPDGRNHVCYNSMYVFCAVLGSGQ